MAAKCGKCDPHEICEECPEWIFTLADLIMCMMGLFVLLWVLKPSPNPNVGQGQPSADDRWIEQVAAIRDAFGAKPDPTKLDDRVNTYMLQKLNLLRSQQSEGQGGETKIKRDAPQGTDPEVTSVRPGAQAIVGGRLAFDKASATLAPDMLGQLQEIATLIRGHRNIVLVKGHTSLDDFGEDGTPVQQMDLSLRRAQAAADYLVSLGVAPDMLRVQGCSTFEPVAQRVYTAGSQSINRRVEVEATRTLVDERKDVRASAPKRPLRTPAAEASIQEH